MGTHQGAIHILDFSGNEIRKWQAHSSTVNEMSIDANGDYIASCSQGGKVVINAMYGSEVQDYNYGRPLAAVALAPDYSRKDTRQFCVGGQNGQLVLNAKGNSLLCTSC